MLFRSRYDKLNIENIQYEKPENQNNVYFGPMYYDLNPLLIQSSRLKVKELNVDNKTIILETDSSDFRFYDDKFYLLEVNTQPGMTELSLVPEIAKYKGINFYNLIKWMINDASINR